MNLIKVLPFQVANQIAAGEVVERPASVVKELIENAIDANATRIEIEIEKGGSRLIRVRDNGEGIYQADLNLALCRHATSKIIKADDLERILSLGFRGEALASIASIARISLSSKRKTQSLAWQVMNNDQFLIGEPKPIAHPLGTTVEVRDLFFNIPARRKFLKTEATEFNHINEVIQRIALCYFNLSIVLTHNQRIIHDFPIANTDALQEARIAKICGTEFIEAALKIDYEATGLHLSGWIGFPTFSRNHPDIQHIYINRRMIKDKNFSYTVKRAYQDVMYQDRYPAFILYLQMDPQSVDVNAHPAKHEVRFHNSKLIYDFVLNSIKTALSHYKPVTRVESAPVAYPVTPAQQNMYLEEGVILINHTPHNLTVSDRVVNTVMPGMTEAALSVAIKPALGFALGQLHGIYILAENEQGLVIVDMHAAHERILYERLKAEFKNQGIARQSLLLPITFSANAQEISIVQEFHKPLKKMAIEIEELGPQMLIVRSLPAALPDVNVVQLIRDIIADLMVMGSSEKIETQFNEWLGNFACRAAVRAHYKLTLMQMNAILRQMEHTPHSSTCNHGRPTWRQFSIGELDKFFLRGR